MAGIFNAPAFMATDETWSNRQAVSHGCVRMTIPDVIDLYPRVPVAPIYIGCRSCGYRVFGEQAWAASGDSRGMNGTKACLLRA